MKKALTQLTFVDLLFLLLLCTSSLFKNPIISEALYYCAFLIPSALGICFARRQAAQPTEDAGYANGEDDDGERLKNRHVSGLTLTKSGALELILLSPVIIVFIMLLSLLTSSVMGAFGITSSVELGESLFVAIIAHALIPTVLEELLFRYVHINMLLPYSKRYAVLFSALYFSLIHMSLFQIPYAFFAGFAFAIINIKTHSILPSLILHFVNNALSVFLMFYGDNERFVTIVYASLATLFIISIVAVIYKFLKRGYHKEFLPYFKERGTDEQIGASPIVFIAVTLCVAVTSIFAV